MSATRSSLETQVVSIMRSLRERGNLERNALARRLEKGRNEGLDRVPGLSGLRSVVGERSTPARMPPSASVNR